MYQAREIWRRSSYFYKALQKDFDNFLSQKWLSIVLANYQSRDKLVQYTKQQRAQRPVNPPRDHYCPDLPGALKCTEQAWRSRSAPHANFETTNYKQRTKTSLSPYRREKLHACRGFFSFFLSFFVTFLFFFGNQTHRVTATQAQNSTKLAAFFFFQMKHKLNAIQA